MFCGYPPHMMPVRNFGTPDITEHSRNTKIQIPCRKLIRERRVYISIRQPMKVGCRSSSYPAIFGRIIPTTETIIKHGCWRANFISAREIARLVLFILVRPDCGSSCSVKDSRSGVYMCPRDQTERTPLQCASAAPGRRFLSNPKPGECRRRLAATEPALQHRIIKIVAFLNTEMPPKMMRGVRARVRV